MLDTIPPDCVVFDTETTGFDPEEGDRLVEIGAVRMRAGLPTRESYHAYINPERSMPKTAERVHGLSTRFLSDKPLFAEVAPDFVRFVGDLPMVAHNAAFDAKFINHHLAELGLPTYAEDRFCDTVPIARKRFPGAQANLDALCRRFKISLAGRDKHGALVDSELLAEVCVELAGGRQYGLFAEIEERDAGRDGTGEIVPLETFVLRATAQELERHAALVAKLGEGAIWHRLEGAA